ncbi:MAG: hypothetical protein R6U13_06145 [Desulfatiglandaceae bacterium]
MKCPGQDSRYWKPGAIFEEPCPHCGTMLEFFKDDVSRICKKCGNRIVNPHMDFGCAAYCRHAAKCFGSLPPEAVAGRDELIKQRIAFEVKKTLGKDFRSIGRSARAAAYAERLAREESGDTAVITAASYLIYVDTGAAREILEHVGAPAEMTDEILDIVSHLNQPGEDGSTNFKVVSDAGLLSRIEAELNSAKTQPGKIDGLVSLLVTGTGEKIGRELLDEFENQKINN